MLGKYYVHIVGINKLQKIIMARREQFNMQFTGSGIYIEREDIFKIEYKIRSNYNAS